MELMVIKNAFVVGIILYLICDEEKNKVKLGLTSGIIYILINVLSIQIQKYYYSIGILICVLEAYFIRFLLCTKWTDNGEKTYLKSIFYYYLNWGMMNVLEYISSVLTSKQWNANSSLMDAMLQANDYWSLIVSMTILYFIIKIGVFELIPYKISRVILWSIAAFEATIAFGMCIGKMPLEIHKESYKITVLCICALITISILYKKKKIEKDNAYYENIIESEYYTYEEMYRREMIIKNIRHDLANHIQVMQGLSAQGMNKEQIAYKKELISDYNAYFEKTHQEKEAIKEEHSKFIGFIKKCGYFALPMALLMSMLLSYYISGNVVMKWINILVIILIVTESVYYVLIIILEQRDNSNMQRVITEGKESDEKWMQIKNTIEESISENNEDCVGQKQIERLSKMMQSVEKKYGDDEVLDVMLNYKDKKCQEQEIHTNWNINLPSEKSIRKIDIVEIFGNLIDNAIEACQRIDADKKYIKIDTFFRANFWMITIENSKALSEHPIKSKFKTKKTGEHGLGMKIIKRIVDNYDGAIEYKDNGDSFVIELMLTLY